LQADIVVGVVALPHMSNFTDFEPLIADAEVELRFIRSVYEAERCDVIVLPGTKRTLHDLSWLKERGFEGFFKHTDKMIVAICGGYQMLFETIIDEAAIESEEACRINGFGLIEGVIEFDEQKVVKKARYDIFGLEVEGYEIHHGVSEKLYVEQENLYGTFVHGLFDSDTFRKKIFSACDAEYQGFEFKTYKAEKIKEFTSHVNANLDIQRVLEAVKSS
jgi:adenosylcobyric acid synthase